MKRRDFIASLALLASSNILPTSVMAKDNKSWQKLYQLALQAEPRLIGHQSYSLEREVDELYIEGKIPNDFQGTFYRNGPALLERGEIRYKHLFDGDGMIHAFKFNNGKVSFKNRFVATHKFNNEENANRFLYDLSNLGLKNPESITSADLINPANTNILPVGDEIWAMWEAGSAHRMDPETLETRGKAQLSEQLAGMPFSAHPKVEADGTIWNFGLDYASGQIVLYKLSPMGKLIKHGILKTGYHAMLHDFLITENHILLILPSLKVNLNKKSFADQQEYDSNKPMQVLVIDKSDFKLKAKYDFPSCFLFHYGNAWEEKDGTIRFDGCRYPNLEILHRLGDVMQGNTHLLNNTTSQSVLFTLYPNGKNKQEFFDGHAEFPRIYPSLTGKKNDKIFTIGDSRGQQWAESIRSLNIHTGKIDEFIYGDDYLVEEHIIVEKPNKKNGYLIGTALNWKSKKTCVSIFDAENINSGPIARVWLPFHIPLGFHGNFKQRV